MRDASSSPRTKARSARGSAIFWMVFGASLALYLRRLGAILMSEFFPEKDGGCSYGCPNEERDARDYAAAQDARL